MADFETVQVDDTYLDSLQTVLGNVATNLVNSPQGSLTTLVLKAGGDSYTHGANVVNRFSATTTALDGLLTAFGNTMSDRASQIRLFRQTTDDTESLNNESADFFNSHFPGWANTSGGNGPGNPPGNNNGNNGNNNGNNGNNNGNTGNG